MCMSRVPQAGTPQVAIATAQWTAMAPKVIRSNTAAAKAAAKAKGNAKSKAKAKAKVPLLIS